jgi:hypothetical protein
MCKDYAVATCYEPAQVGTAVGLHALLPTTHSKAANPVTILNALLTACAGASHNDMWHSWELQVPRDSCSNGLYKPRIGPRNTKAVSYARDLSYHVP